MAAPTVTAVAPTSGLSRRGGLVTVTGTDFETTPGEVTVAFGPRLAFDVRVTSDTSLTCIAPIGAILDDANTLVVDVTVTNLSGPNAGSGTLVDAYTYRRPDLTVETHLSAVVRKLIQRAKQQILANVSQMTHTDWQFTTSDPLQRVEPADLPALVLIGPDLDPHQVTNYNDKTLTMIGDPASDYTKHHPPRAVSLEFEVRLQSASNVELLNLIQHATMFVHRTGLLEGIPRDPLIPGAGTVDYPLVLVEDFAVVSRPSRANVRESVGRWRVEGVLLEAGDLLEAAPTIDVAELTSEQIP